MIAQLYDLIGFFKIDMDSINNKTSSLVVNAIMKEQTLQKKKTTFIII